MENKSQVTPVDTLQKMNTIAGMLLFYTLLVIVWGAWVRISHSGDGCGKSWPLCEGSIIPTAPGQKTLTEYLHRLMSGIYGLVVIGIFAWTRKKTFGPALRRLGTVTLVLMIIEALLGAKLVLFGLVGRDDSYFRIGIMALHQINSLLLTGAAFLLFKLSRTPANSLREDTPRSLFRSGQSYYLLFILLIAMTGSWASLSNTLHPGNNLLQGIIQDFADDSNRLLRLRVIHPLIATMFSLWAIWRSWMNYQLRQQKEALSIVLVFGVAFCFGWMTLLSHAPIWMKLFHLLIAHGVWIFIINSIFDWTQPAGLKTESAR